MYWYIEGNPELSMTAKTLIREASNDILISPALPSKSASGSGS